MRDRTKEFTSGPGGPPPDPTPGGNAFSHNFLCRLRELDHPPTPESANAGPWTVEPMEPVQTIAPGGEAGPDRSSEASWPAEPSESCRPEGAAPAAAPPSGTAGPLSQRAPDAPTLPATRDLEEPEVVRRHVDALASRTFQPETEWACRSIGGSAPRAVLERPDLAYLFAAALPLDGAPPRLRLARRGLDEALAGGPGWHRLAEDGRSVGRLAGFRPELVALANALAALRSRPLALAHLLAACGEETLEPAGQILDGLVRKGVG